MPLYRAQVTLRDFTNIPEDVSTNTLYFTTPEGTSDATSGLAIEQRLTTFYQAVDQWFSPVVTSAAGLKVYNMADPEPRLPVWLGTIALTPATGNGSPEENAIVLSFQAPPVSGASQARRRGPIFLGPFAQTAYSVGTTTAFREIFLPRNITFFLDPCQEGRIIISIDIP